MRFIPLLTLAGALAVSACGSKPERPPEAENNMMEVPEDMIPENEAPPVVEVPNNSAPAAPPPKVSEDQQMQDDADATGLTASLPEDDGGVPTNQVRQGE